MCRRATSAEIRRLASNYKNTFIWSEHVSFTEPKHHQNNVLLQNHAVLFNR